MEIWSWNRRSYGEKGWGGRRERDSHTKHVRSDAHRNFVNVERYIFNDREMNLQIPILMLECLSGSSRDAWNGNDEYLDKRIVWNPLASLFSLQIQFWILLHASPVHTNKKCRASSKTITKGLYYTYFYWIILMRDNTYGINHHLLRLKEMLHQPPMFGADDSILFEDHVRHKLLIMR